MRSPVFSSAIAPNFVVYLRDLIDFAELRYREIYAKSYADTELCLFEKYSRRDACRLLNWPHDDSATIYGYPRRFKQNCCPIFINLEKEEGISASTMYEDGFINKSVFSWMTRNRVTLESDEIKAMKKSQATGLRILLFVKKKNAEGSDFYFLGQMDPIDYKQGLIGSKSKDLDIVNVKFALRNQVRDDIYDYLTN